jgi:hypothetical protein
MLYIVCVCVTQITQAPLDTQKPISGENNNNANMFPIKLSLFAFEQQATGELLIFKEIYLAWRVCVCVCVCMCIR